MSTFACKMMEHSGHNSTKYHDIITQYLGTQLNKISWYNNTILGTQLNKISWYNNTIFHIN